MKSKIKKFPEHRTSFKRYKPLVYSESEDLSISNVEVIGLATVRELVVRIPGLVRVGDDGYIQRIKKSSRGMMVSVSIIPKDTIDLADPSTGDLFVIVAVAFREHPDYWYFLLTQGDKYWPLKATVGDNSSCIAIYCPHIFSMHDINKCFEAMPRRRFGYEAIKKLESMTTADHGLIGSSIYEWLLGNE